MKAFMGRMMAGVSRLVGKAGGGLGKWIMKPGQMIMVAGKQVWQAGEWALDTTADIVEYGIEAVDTAVGFTAQAAIHVGQDIVAGTGAAVTTVGKFAWNNPVSKVARNVGNFMIGDHRPRIEPNKISKNDAKKSVQADKNANPAELAALKAAYIKNDPELVERYVGAENKAQRDAAFEAMSPKAQSWVKELQPTDLWSLKGKSAVEIAAHMAGDKAIAGVANVESYYGAVKAAEAAPDVQRDKTVTERRQERTAKKIAKRDAANGATPEVAGTVPGQAPEVKSTAQQEVMAFFGPKVAKEEEVSEYSQAALPAYRPPVPMQRKAMA
ncbi:hypothetical protein V6R85_24255 [Agrobacterium sp. CCNWLW32]|uniref:hypothetical protein n=1 Tax=Agrobacterium sp. CCNWLW32 TaxID=3122072 RepID=UPI00300FBF54